MIVMLSRYVFNRRGFSPVYIIVVIALLLGAGAVILYFATTAEFNKEPKQQPAKATQKAPQTAQTQTDKSDPKWLEKYCQQEVIKLPTAPFTYEKLEGPSTSMPEGYMRVPDDKWSRSRSCVLKYNYDPRKAYSSLGMNYDTTDEKIPKMFEEQSDQLFTKQMQPDWKKLSPLSDKEAGRPGYSYKGFPLLFSRETSTLGTVDYVTAFFGANVFYVKFTTYEK